MAILRRLWLALAAVVLLYPIAIMISGSFQSMSMMMFMPPKLLPLPATLKNYADLFMGLDVLPWIKNTLIVVFGNIVGAVVVASFAGYGFSVYRFKGRKAAMMFLLALVVIPNDVIIIPTFMILRVVRLLNNPMGVILPRIISVMGLLLFKAYIDQIAVELIDAGRIDGAGEWRIMLQLILPQCTPIMGFMAIVHGVMGFSDFFMQLLVLQRASARTFIVGMIMHVRALDTNMHINEISVAMAVGTILFVPMLILFLSTNKLFMKGLSMSGVRG